MRKGYEILYQVQEKEWQVIAMATKKAKIRM